MHIEVDQSGKVEDTGDTALALSDGIDHSILIPSKVKRAAFRLLGARRKTKKMATIWLFAACLFLLLEDYLDVIQRVIIDLEYAGREADIKGILLMLIRHKRPTFPKDRIDFARVGKKSPAHSLAWTVHRGEREADRRITEAELLELLQQKDRGNTFHVVFCCLATFWSGYHKVTRPPGSKLIYHAICILSTRDDAGGKTDRGRPFVMGLDARQSSVRSRIGAA